MSKYLIIMLSFIIIMIGYISHIDTEFIIAETILYFSLVIAYCSDEICKKLTQRKN